MKMIPFRSHPSVRIKGVENNYEPILCEDSLCSMQRSLAPHLHCPFCAKTEVYQDPVILKAHFRVKHVDKSIEFAGLKILRCCNSCDIVGSIKCSKEFKGAHWHCYRCKNGFNRRDEALKHYKTHFRNPQTTFQIQLCQDVNQDLIKNSKSETDQATESLRSQNVVTILHPMANAISTANVNGSSRDQDLQVGVAANETVDSSDNAQTIMIIAEEDRENLGSTTAIETQAESTILYMNELNAKEEITQNLKTLLKSREDEIETLTDKVKQMEQERSHHIQEINDLKLQLELQNEELKLSNRREEELLQQIGIPLSDKIQELLQVMKSQHENLLHQQLIQLKRAYTSSSLEDQINNRVLYIANIECEAPDDDEEECNTDHEAKGQKTNITHEELNHLTADIVNNDTDHEVASHEFVGEDSTDDDKLLKIKSEQLTTDIDEQQIFVEDLNELEQLQSSTKRKTEADNIKAVKKKRHL